MAAIFYMSSKQGGEIRLIAPDYVLHAIEYGGLSLVVYNALKSTWSGLNYYLAAIVIAVLYGLTDEFHQMFVPGRDASLLDLLADFVGAAIVQFILWGHSRMRQRDVGSD